GQTPSVRLREPLQQKISELLDLKNEPGFDRLSPERQAFVGQRLAELEDYRRYKEQVQRGPSPQGARSDGGLNGIEPRRLEMPPAAAVQWDWRQTEAVLLRVQRLEEVKALRAAVAQVEGWYRKLVDQGERLGRFDGPAGLPLSLGDWPGQVHKLLLEAASP